MGSEKYMASPIDVLCDNQSAIELLKNAVCHKQAHWHKLPFHAQKKKEITIRYLQTSVMPADILTKALPKCGHLRGV